MPKMKTHTGAKKRFKRTANGKYKFQRTHKRHLRQGGYVDHAQHHQVEALLPYGT